MKSNKVLDAKGLACPMPVVRARKVMKEMETGEVLEILATDKGSVADLAAWSKSGGHDLVKHTEEAGVFTFWIQKG
ncbi:MULTISPECIES: sulfurtransferase TusA family protein [unclassified Sporosarcina]|uniref:sulfurtransferase TusA family protein n=1 Tax=unclassified Sporosarcina TaxID=2647733 RepID=UPI0016478919|nr:MULTISPECIES: sulfurtransferase TusA family protein [unclassified Sporosarcina]MBO0586697.1 sulfurtransferase TusA family protein [Sporosarcina sp. E16_8]